MGISGTWQDVNYAVYKKWNTYLDVEVINFYNLSLGDTGFPVMKVDGQTDSTNDIQICMAVYGETCGRNDRKCLDIA